ncbi:MAG: hemerythrin family protein [Novosphingobium sp.]|nr:hemerythrin family protein [Novosphingobium sp.]
MALEWKDEYSTGVDKVDEQHRKLFAFLNDLEEFITQGIDSGPKVDSLLVSLATDVQTHFSFEEHCMKQYNCPVARENKEAHNEFLRQFGNFQHEYKAKGSSVSLLKKLHETAESWVVNHICNIDIHLKSCVGKGED